MFCYDNDVVFFIWKTRIDRESKCAEYVCDVVGVAYDPHDPVERRFRF